MNGTPVVSTPRSVLMKPKPLQVMPLGLATTFCNYAEARHTIR